MKQFSLKNYLKNTSRKVVTRDGKRARIICTDAKNYLPVIALIDNGGKEYIQSYYPNGAYYAEGSSSLDLFFAPEKHEGWVNMYRDRDRKGKYIIADSEIYPTKEVASNYMLVGPDYIDTIKVEWEE